MKLKSLLVLLIILGLTACTKEPASICYVDLVRGALKKKQVDSAEHYLASLRSVSPGSAQLPELETSLSALRASERDTFVAGKVFHDRLQDGSNGPKMVWIAGGRFKMGDIQGGGSSNEQPVHEVSVGRFAMGCYEVTFAEYDKFAEATGRNKPPDSGWGRGNRPVIYVSWYDATAYAEWLSEQTGQKYRLPTEAEWEYAARAGTTTKYWWGNKIGSNKANCWKFFCGDSFKYTAPVGSFAPNAFGLYDTVGNVWEWTCSEYEDKYSGKEQRCLSKNIANNKSHFVLRGGAWDIGARWTRSASRDWRQPAVRGRLDGFRLARLVRGNDKNLHKQNEIWCLTRSLKVKPANQAERYPKPGRSFSTKGKTPCWTGKFSPHVEIPVRNVLKFFDRKNLSFRRQEKSVISLIGKICHFDDRRNLSFLCWTGFATQCH
jgi:formylglycine-generating enzyme required for sulfatase activity